MRTLARLTCLAVAVVAASSPLGSFQQAGSGYDTFFTDRTMRVDYFHTGGRGLADIISLDRVVADGSWPGSRTRLVDSLNLGAYMFEVIDPGTNRVIYSRGFGSIYGEWETTAEPSEMHRTFHESVRFPWPKAPVQVVVKKRDKAGSFHEVWSTVVDPNSRFVNTADLKPAGKVWSLFENGTPTAKVDLLVLGDGYTTAQLPKFHEDVKRLLAALFREEPFKSRQSDFNVRAIDLPSDDPGVNRPQAQSFRRTRLAMEYNIFDSERYLLTYDNRMLRDVASQAPYDVLEVLVNESQYGGGGIYNAQATSSVDSAFSEYVFVHEFGHHLAALADEYYTSDVAYQTGGSEHPEPWEPNITALHDPAKLKWRDLVEPGTPIPTPWDKEAWEKSNREVQARRRALRQKGAPESEMNKLFDEERTYSTKFLGSMTYSKKVGAFEGAGYETKGLYRPEIDCIMFTRDQVGFCRVCQRAIGRVLDEYSQP